MMTVHIQSYECYNCSATWVLFCISYTVPIMYKYAMYLLTVSAGQTVEICLKITFPGLNLLLLGPVTMWTLTPQSHPPLFRCHII